MPIPYLPGHRRSMTSRVFGLRAAQFSGLLRPAPAQQVHRHRVFRRRPQRVDVRVGSIGRDIVAHDDPDAGRRLFPSTTGALCPGCVPAAKGMRSSAAMQGESRYNQTARWRFDGRRRTPPRDRAWSRRRWVRRPFASEFLRRPARFVLSACRGYPPAPSACRAAGRLPAH
jgi:hypothetical protein